MKLKSLIKQLGGNRAAIAERAGISTAKLNNYVSEGRSVLPLADGGYVLVTANTRVFRSVEL